MATQEKECRLRFRRCTVSRSVFDGGLRSVNAHTYNPSIIGLLTVTGLLTPARHYPTPDTALRNAKTPPGDRQGLMVWRLASFSASL